MQTLYRLLAKVRPAPLATFLKKILRVKRQLISTKAGHRFSVDPVSHFGREVIDLGVYEPEMTEFIRTLLRPGDIFLDVGANEGYFSVLGCSLVGTGNVFSIEPQSRLIPVIERNFSLNGSKNASIHHLALADSEGEMTLHLTSDTNSGGSSFFRRSRFVGASEKVSTKTLDNFVRAQGIERVRLIKLDCEGAEGPILKGANQFLSAGRADFVSVDYHPHIIGEANAAALDASLRKLGYRLTRAGNGVWVYHLPGIESELSALGTYREVPALAA